MLIDTHTHFDLFGENETQALAEIIKYRILSIANTMDPDSYQKNLELGRNNELILPIFGIHPFNAVKWVDKLLELNWAFDQSPMYGEIGLDSRFAKDDSQWQAQNRVFQFFLDKTREQNKTVIVHSKGNEQAVFDIIKKHPLKKCIMHWFSGSLDFLPPLVSLGAYFTIGVEILYSDHIKNIAREIPPERLLTETDNPLVKLSLADALGLPRNIIEVVSALAAVKKTTVEGLMGLIQENFQRIVRDDPTLLKLFSSGKE
jgi:TatD DNase family protein